MYNRYLVCKQLHPDRVIFIRKKKMLITFGVDEDICTFIKFEGKFSLLERKNISYIVLDGLDIIDYKTYDSDIYYKYEVMALIYKVLCIINNKYNRICQK